jgi:hypothetical protein
MLEVCELDANKFDALQKVITLLEDAPVISIRDGVINNLIETNIIIADLTAIFGNNFNIDIVNPKKYLKLFKTISKSKVKLYDDPSMGRYVITNNNVKLFLPKKQNTPIFDQSEFSDFQQLGESITIKDNKKTVKSFVTNDIKLLIHNNEFIGILNDELGIYKFPEYSTTDSDINEDDCEILVSYGFLSIDSEIYDVKLGTKDNNFWLFTTIDFDNISKIYILENVNKKNIDNVLI